MLNPTCPCGEVMELDDPADAAFQWIPGSPEIHQLFALAARGIVIWNCMGCGYIMPAGWSGVKGRRSRSRRDAQRP